MKLSIIIPCIDTRGASIVLQSLLLHHVDATRLSEILVIGPRAAHKWLATYIEHFSHGRFINFLGKPTPSCLLNAGVAMASYQHVLCVQPDCFLGSGVIDRLLEFYNFNFDSADLFQGPLAHKNQEFLQAHNMFEVITDKVKRGTPFPIQTQDLGVFSCRRDAWPGTNELFKVLDGTGYIHDKFRARGAKCFCLPWFSWSRPPVTTLFSADDQAHDLALWYAEMGHNPRKMFDQIDVEYPEAVSMFKRSHLRCKLAPLRHPVIAPGYEHLISCLTVVGDASDHALNECIESFRRQTYPRRELIIVNDKADRQINIEMPLVKIVNIPDFRPETILTITGGDFICFWPADRVPYHTKLSVMMTNLTDSCSWVDECFDASFRKSKLPATILLTRAALTSMIDNAQTIDDIIAKFKQAKLPLIQDIQGDTSCSLEKGDKLYRLTPFWFNRTYERVSTSPIPAYPRIKSITAFLLMYNLLEWPLAIIDKLRKLKIRVVLVDQGSTYPPLLDYYKKCGLDLRKLPHPICRSEFIIHSGMPAEFCDLDEFYLVLDNDIDISDLPYNIVKMMVKVIRDYGGPAAGLSVKPGQQRKVAGRPRYWDEPGGSALFPFTIYRMGTKVQGMPQKYMPDPAIRHLPWELDVADGLNEELLYYLRQRLVFNRAADPKLIDKYLALVEKTSNDS